MDHILTISETEEAPPERRAPEFTVKGFGKISKASLRVAPLTILVGRNNTGKSYIATLLWAMLSAQDALFSTKSESSLASPQWFLDYVRNSRGKRRVAPLEITGKMLSDELNYQFRTKKNAIIQNLFSYSSASIESLEISIEGSIWLMPARTIPRELASIKHLKSNPENSWQLSWNKKPLGDAVLRFATFVERADKDIDDDARELFVAVISKFLNLRPSGYGSSATYVPAARTGLMLSLSALYTSLIENFGIGEAKADRGRFSLPTIRFLQRITRDRSPHTYAPFAHIADFLETKIVKGSVLRDDGRATNFSYQPVGSDHRLPLHAVSSMVSELSPLVTLLRQSSLGTGLVFEEPEAHLHLSAQRWMARTIAKLVNHNIPVIITTHSDTFLQQINLLIQLSGHKDKKELMERYGYTDDELLELNQVEAYEFCSEDNATVVKVADKSEGGIIVKTLNETLYNLAEEALAVDDD